ncbi:HEPN domain-containing protein [Vibrio fluvialis]
MHLQSCESTDSLTEELINIQKGLFYVHLYSAFEKSINEIVVRTLTVIGTKKIKHQHYTTAFNSIALDAQMASFKSAGKDRRLSCAVGVFETMECSNESKINDSIFAPSLQNVWFDTVQILFRCFGIAGIDDADGSFKLAIDEVVNNRNAVAHGRIPAQHIGERQRCDVLSDRLRKIESCTGQIVEKFESYLDNKEYLKPVHRADYT